MKKTSAILAVLILTICTLLYPHPISAAPMLKTPSITQIKSVDSGAYITWGKVYGAAAYRVFVKTASGWKKLGDTKSNCFTDKSVKSGTVRTYTVRCINASKTRFTSGYNRKGSKFTYNMPTPLLTHLTSTEKGIQLRWTSAKEAKRYRVFRKSKTGWTRIADTTETVYTDEAVEQGVTYTYTVRCLSNDRKKYTSAYNKQGRTVTCQSFHSEETVSTEVPTQAPTQAPTEPAPAIPTITSLTCTNDSVIIKWSLIDKVQSYYLYYQKEGQDWKYYTPVKGGEYEFYNPDRLKEGEPISFSLQYDKLIQGKFVRISDTIGKTIVFHSTGVLPDLKTARPTWFKPERYQTINGVCFDLSYTGEDRCTVGKDEVETFGGQKTYKSISYTLYADSSIDPDDLVVKVNGGKIYDIDRYDNVYSRYADTSSLASDSPDPEVFRARLRAWKATKELPSYSCRVNGNKGYAVASVKAVYSYIQHKDKLSRYIYDDYKPNGTLKLTVNVSTVFAQKASFPIEISYKGKTLKRTVFDMDLVKGVSSFGSYDKMRDFLDNAESACWTNGMTPKEKMSTLARYLNKNYTYGEMICCSYAAYMAIAAQDLGLPTALVVPAVNAYSNVNESEQDALLRVYLQEIGYPVIFNIYEGIPPIHCYCVAKLDDGAYYHYEGTGGKNGNGGYIAEKSNADDSSLYTKRGR